MVWYCTSTSTLDHQNWSNGEIELCTCTMHTLLVSRDEMRYIMLSAIDVIFFQNEIHLLIMNDWLIDSIMCALKKFQTKWVHFDPFWFVQMIHILIFLTDENLTFLLPTCVRVPVVKLCLRYCIYYIRTGRCSSLLHVTCSSHSLLSLLPYITSIWDRGRIGTIGGNTSSSGFALVDSFF